MNDSPPDTALPAGLARDRHLDLEGRHRAPWARRLGIGLIAAVLVLALADVFGQVSSTRGVVAPAATLTLHSPERVRGGLIYQSRFDVIAHRALAQPKLVLGAGWNDGLTINTIEPSSAGEASRNGQLVLTFDKMAPGDRLTLWIDYQVNPTHVGRTAQDVELDDRNTVLARLHGSLAVLP